MMNYTYLDDSAIILNYIAIQFFWLYSDFQFEPDLPLSCQCTVLNFKKNNNNPFNSPSFFLELAWHNI